MLEIVLSVLGALGGGALIIGGFAHWLGNLWAKRLIQGEKAKLDQQIESYKVRLRKSEFIFQKEYEAASELVAYIQEILPAQYIPDMIWDDVCEYIAHDFREIENSLRNYLGKHGAILPKSAAEKVEECIYLAGSMKHEVGSQEVSRDAVKAAHKLVEHLREAEKSLVEQVRGQSTT